jgi:hypothetical protein
VAQAVSRAGSRTHGRSSTYTHGCRCELCREAVRVARWNKRHPEDIQGELSPELERKHDDAIDLLLELLHRT